MEQTIHAKQHIALARLAKRLGLWRIDNYLMDVAICQICAQIRQIIPDEDFIRRYEANVRPYWAPEKPRANWPSVGWELIAWLNIVVALPVAVIALRYWTEPNRVWQAGVFFTFLAVVPALTALICLGRSRKVRYE